MNPLVERHYVIDGEETTANLPGVISPISRELYEHAARLINIMGDSAERSLGQIEDPTKYYVFQGSNVLLEHGLAQVGKATTTDNTEGFDMMRFFANSLEEMAALERESGF
jgi:hypothetical protein